MPQDIKRDIELEILDTKDPDRREFASRLLTDVREGERQLEQIKADKKARDDRTLAVDLAAKLKREMVPQFGAQEVRMGDIKLAIRLLEDYAKVIDELHELHRESGH